jgi:hypothetical protein
MSQFSPFHILTISFSEINFNGILPFYVSSQAVSSSDVYQIRFYNQY